MASFFFQLALLVPCLFFHPSSAARHLIDPSSKNDNNPDQFSFRYHNGTLLAGVIPINLIWYGKFSPAQRSIVSDFITSSSAAASAQPSVASWWKSVEKYHRSISPTGKPSTPGATLRLGRQVLDDSCSLGKSLTGRQIRLLAAKGGHGDNAINVVLTASDVAVEGFCSARCGTHASLSKSEGPYVWVGNPDTQCPGQCAWPFHQPMYGPQAAPLMAPNNDVGMDGVVINLAGLLVGTVTNPFGRGFYQGPQTAPLEAASACPGMFGSGAYPGYAGMLLVDPASGASYNAQGAHGRKYLVPALMDPISATCSALV